MTMVHARRRLLQSLGLGLATAGIGLTASARAAATGDLLLGDGARDLPDLMARLAAAPRRRDFKTVPMILDDPAQWDDAALKEVMAYKPATKQVWDNSAIDGFWLPLMSNSLNTQVWSFKHPDFLAVSATHGSAAIALYDRAMWDKYPFAKLLGGKVKASLLAEGKPFSAADVKDYENPKGVFAAGNVSISLLMRRGIVFLTCHNAIWEHAGKLIEENANPDKLAQDALAAELTNHLRDNVVLTPGAVATIPELQQVGFHYAK